MVRLRMVRTDGTNRNETSEKFFVPTTIETGVGASSEATWLSLIILRAL